MKNIIYGVILLFVVCFGCSKKNENTDQPIKTEDIKPKNTEVLTGRLPDDFPKDIPLYKDAKILTSGKSEGITTVTFEIDDKAKSVGDFYKQIMPKNGYEPDKNNNMITNVAAGIISFKKGIKTFDFSYRYNDEKGKTILTIMIK
jgi:hypothetical protein